MARLARIVIPNCPHHITQRGNRRQNVFFNRSDYHKYLELLKHHCNKENIEILAYCLMTNHVHLIATPSENSDLSKAVGQLHKNYTRMINQRQKWSGYLWQGRFSSFPMDEPYLLQAAAYVELNPVMAGMVKNPWDYAYSSVHAHLSGYDKFDIVKTDRLLDLVDDWKNYLLQAKEHKVDQLQKHSKTGRILGSETFVNKAEQLLKRKLKKNKPGPKIRNENN